MQTANYVGVRLLLSMVDGELEAEGTHGIDEHGDDAAHAVVAVPTEVDAEADLRFNVSYLSELIVEQANRIMNETEEKHASPVVVFVFSQMRS